MKLLKDLVAHLKEWSDWKMKDWIKAGIVAIVVLFIISKIFSNNCILYSEFTKALNAHGLLS